MTITWLQLYLFIKAYLENKSIRIIAFKFLNIAGIPIIRIVVYKYEKIRYGRPPGPIVPKKTYEAGRPQCG